MGDADANRASCCDVQRITANGERTAGQRWIAEERPVAIEVNGVGYAVLMATPGDIEDFVTGFLLTERLIDTADDLLDLDQFEHEHGLLARATVAAACAERVVDRVRHRATDSSCGLCGIENLEQALRPLPALTSTTAADDAAIFRALKALEDHQPLNRLTRAVHGAALCDAGGAIRMVREDVGRHNAFDKLIGAVARAGLSWQGGFALLTSRCSFELVEKAVIAGCPMLVTVSAGTSLALARAREAGLALRILARPDALLDVSLS